MQISLKLVSEEKKAVRQPTTAPAEKPPFLDEANVVPENKPPGSLGAGRRILVVDDNPVVLKAFELKLRASGFTVVTLTNASEVAGTAEKTGAELIILDINFPAGGAMDWSGYTIMQWLRRFPELAGIPVILISGEDAKGHQEKALAQGAVAFFQKPVAFPELLSAICKALGIPG